MKTLFKVKITNTGYNYWKISKEVQKREWKAIREDEGEERIYIYVPKKYVKIFTNKKNCTNPTFLNGKYYIFCLWEEHYEKIN